MQNNLRGGPAETAKLAVASEERMCLGSPIVSSRRLAPYIMVRMPAVGFPGFVSGRGLSC
jgi:hypothetical protein